MQHRSEVRDLNMQLMFRYPRNLCARTDELGQLLLDLGQMSHQELDRWFRQGHGEPVILHAAVVRLAPVLTPVAAQNTIVVSEI